MPYFGLIAESDLSDKQFYAVQFVGGADKDFRVELCSSVVKYAGILLNKPKAGEAATVSRPEDLFSKVKLGAVVLAGALLTVDPSDGTLITGSSAIVAISPVNGVDGEITSVFLK